MKQKGQNSNYPQEISIWKMGEKVPEWLSNVAQILGIDDANDTYILGINRLSKGGYEIKDSSGQNVLVRVWNDDNYVCYGDGRFFSLSPTQLKLLYLWTKN